MLSKYILQDINSFKVNALLKNMIFGRLTPSVVEVGDIYLIPRQDPRTAIYIGTMLGASGVITPTQVTHVGAKPEDRKFSGIDFYVANSELMISESIVRCSTAEGVLVKPNGNMYAGKKLCNWLKMVRRNKGRL